MRSYERFKPLRVQDGGLLRGYGDVQPGDCVVAFTRRHIYDIKNTIEVTTGHRYGAAASSDGWASTSSYQPCMQGDVPCAACRATC